MHRGGRNLKVSLHVGLGRWAPVHFGVVVNEREELTLPPRVVTSHSGSPLERLAQNGREQRVKFCSGRGLQSLEHVHFSLHFAEALLLKLREQKGSPTSNQTDSE